MAYHRNVERLAAFVLAGGKSSRMGRDKALLLFGEETLLSQSLKLLRSVAGRVGIVGDASKFADYGWVVEDHYRERGPLGAIHAALSESHAEWNLMFAVDMPFVEARLLEYLTTEARMPGVKMVTVPQVGGKIQPLCAVYRREFLELAERALQKGENKIDRLFSEENTRVIGEEELSEAGFSAEMFRNLNTPEDLERALAKRL
jgi:molybdopterin-guanine dinucleotide biosynthesis protein A